MTVGVEKGGGGAGGPAGWLWLFGVEWAVIAG